MKRKSRSTFLEDSRADFRRYVGPGPHSWLLVCRVLLRTYGLQATLTHRFGRALLKLTKSPAFIFALPLWPMYWLASAAIRGCYGVRLKLSADIGPGLYIGHFGSILVEHCTIGSECSIAQQTVISGPPSGTALRIGSRVWIGAHARINGAITIGDGATVGAGCRVTADVPARALVMGNPARCVNAAYDNTAFLFPKVANETLKSPAQVP